MATPSNATQSNDAKAKIRHQYQVVFHTGNDKALEALASAAGVNDESVRRPYTVSQWIKAVMLQTIADTHEKRGFKVDLESQLETRNVAVPAEIAMLPQDVQDKLMAMSAPERKAALAVLQAEALRLAMLQNGSVLSELAKKLATPTTDA